MTKIFLKKDGSLAELTLPSSNSVHVQDGHLFVNSEGGSPLFIAARGEWVGCAVGVDFLEDDNDDTAVAQEGQPIMTYEQRKEFIEKAKPLIKWLCDNGHPHMTIAITQHSAELLEGVAALVTKEYILAEKRPEVEQ